MPKERHRSFPLPPQREKDHLLDLLCVHEGSGAEHTTTSNQTHTVADQPDSLPRGRLEGNAAVALGGPTQVCHHRVGRRSSRVDHLIPIALIGYQGQERSKDIYQKQQNPQVL